MRIISSMQNNISTTQADQFLLQITGR